MRTIRTQFLILAGALFFFGGSERLHAYSLDKVPPASVSSSFLLVASPQMSDPRFRKTVLLVTRHGRTGPIGVIVNRQQEITLDKLFPDFSGAQEFNLFTGGPMYPRQISYLVRGGEAVAGAMVISRELYLAYDIPVLGELLGGKRRHTGLRVMHGLASWAPGQLEEEIKRGGWLVLPLDDADIFDRPPVAIWQELHRRASGLAR